MSVAKIIGALGFVVAVGMFSLQAEASGRSDVAAQIKAACAGGASAPCKALIKAQLAAAAKLGNSPAGLAIAQGLADAVADIGQADPASGTELATIVASDGENFVQVAFGAVLDGSGTASKGRRGGRERDRDRDEKDKADDGEGHQGHDNSDHCEERRKNCAGSDA
jgi:hypothetical protein